MNKPLQKYLRTRTLVFPIAIPCIPTMVPRIPIIPLIPRISTMIPHIPTLILRSPTLIPCIPTLIPRIPIIPLIPFPDSPFRLLQIASYLDINHFSSKIDHLREICSKSPIDILCLDETKLYSYPDAQFEIPGYLYLPYRKDRNKNGDGKIVFITEGLITKRLEAFEGDTSETIYLEVAISSLVYNLCLATST